MVHYFFDIDDGRIIKDLIGTDLPDLGLAHAYADGLASVLSSTSPRRPVVSIRARQPDKEQTSKPVKNNKPPMKMPIRIR